MLINCDTEIFTYTQHAEEDMHICNITLQYTEKKSWGASTKLTLWIDVKIVSIL